MPKVWVAVESAFQLCVCMRTDGTMVKFFTAVDMRFRFSTY